MGQILLRFLFKKVGMLFFEFYFIQAYKFLWNIPYFCNEKKNEKNENLFATFKQGVFYKQ